MLLKSRINTLARQEEKSVHRVKKLDKTKTVLSTNRSNFIEVKRIFV